MPSELFKYALVQTVQRRTTEDLRSLLPAYKEQLDQLEVVVKTIENELDDRKQRGEG